MRDSLLKTIIMLAFLTCSINCIQLILEDGNNLVFNSSMRKGTISVSLSSHGKLDSSFYLQSQLLSPLMNKHQLTHGSEKIQVKPQLKQQLVLFNAFDGSQYWFTIKHQVKFNDQNHQINFVGLRVTDGQNVHDYLLPTFPLPFSFLKIDTIYRCGSTIIAVTAQGSRLDMALFAKSGDGSWYDLQGEWGWHWEKRQQNSYDYGRYTRKDKQSTVKIQTRNGKYCEINPLNISKAQNKGLQLTRYLSIQQVLNNLTPLQQHETVNEQEIDQQL